MHFSGRQQREVLESIITNGNFVVAEIYRVSVLTPKDFIDPVSSPFNKLLADFSYFENKELLENFVEHNENGNRLDDVFYETFSSFLKVFSSLLNAICSFTFDFYEYSKRIGSTMKNTSDGRLTELNTRKCEALYLFGVIVLLMESEFPGTIKERIFVALYRSGIEIPSKNFELLISILRKRKENYERCFSNFTLNEQFVDDVLAFMNSAAFENIHTCDSEIYAAKIYVCLYFKQSILESDLTTMRQMADKFFNDKWVISLHLALQVNVREKWASYKAANAALAPLVNAASARRLATDSLRHLKESALPSGLLSVKSLEDHCRLIIEHNANLRWLILHLENTKTLNRSRWSSNSSQPYAKVTVNDLVMTLSKLSHFEYKVRESCKFLIGRKSDNSKRLKSKVIAIFEQIISFLASITTTKNRNQWSGDKLCTWLTSIRDCVTDLDLNDTSSAQILSHLYTKIQEVGDLYVDEHVILRQYLVLIAEEMTQIQAVCGINYEFIYRLNRCANTTYLYLFIRGHLDAFESLLKRDAVAVKYIFLKLSAAITNIAELVTDEEKRNALSTFYYKMLESQLKKIIRVIPRAIFLGMDDLNNIFTARKTIHIQKTNIKEAAELDRRYRLAKKTAEVTKLSLGISDICIKQLGSVEIRPRDLLFDGLNRELDTRLRDIFHVSAPNIVSVLDAQTQRLRTFRKVFLFICEYIGVNGALMWQSCITRYCDESFADARIRHLSIKQLELSSISSRGHKATESMMRRHVIETLLEQILTMTSPRTTCYHPLSNSWLSNTKRLNFSTDVFAIIESWIPSKALCGLRRIILRGILDLFSKFRIDFGKILSMYAPLTRNQSITKSVNAIVKAPEFQAQYAALTTLLSKIGQLKILEENFFHFIGDQIKTSMEDITDASKNFLRILFILNKKSSTSSDTIRLSQELYDYFQNISEQFSNKDSDTVKSPQTVCALLLAIVTSLSTENAITNKRAETVDILVVDYGLAIVLTLFHIRREFSTAGELFFNQNKSAPIVKQIIKLCRTRFVR